MKRLVDPLRHRLRRHIDGEGEHGSDEGAALLLVIMLMLVVASLGVIISMSVIQQTAPAMFMQKRASTVSAAEAGLDAALSQIRTAAGSPDVTGKIYGSPTKLPCEVSGAVSNASPTLSYYVAITYWTGDPTSSSSTRIDCPVASGSGNTPKIAVLASKGLSDGVPGPATSAGDRQLKATYAFKLTNENRLGGLMMPVGQGWCITASGFTEGSTLTYTPIAQCSATEPSQLFQWDTDYRIRLSSTTVKGSTALCLTGAVEQTVTVTLRKCDASRVDQLYSYKDGTVLWGQKADNTRDEGHCLIADTTDNNALAGKLLKYGTNCWGTGDAWGAWAPAAAFGAGAAGKATNQIVNYAQFGRCFDIAYLSMGYRYEFLYPCKQDPSGRTGVAWNQAITYQENATDQVTALDGNSSSSTYNQTMCLTTVPSNQSQPAKPYFDRCAPKGTDPTQLWKRTGEVPGNYGASYTFIDTYGRCMGYGPLDEPNRLGNVIVVEPCSGTSAQKWNAPPDASQASVSSVHEVVRGS